MYGSYSIIMIIVVTVVDFSHKKKDFIRYIHKEISLSLQKKTVSEATVKEE